VNKSFRIGYGPMLDPIADQLKKQGFYVEEAEKYEKQRHAISMLYIPGLMSETEHTKILGRLHKAICNDVKKIFNEESQKEKTNE